MWKSERKLHRGVVLSALVLAVFKEPFESKHELEDLSKKLADLMKANVVDLTDFDISPGGEFSDDVARFVGNNLIAGYAQKRSPLVFTNRGLELCRSVLRDAKKDQDKFVELKKIAEVLNIDLSRIE